VAIPGSQHMLENKIRAVLSVIQFDRVDGTDELARQVFLNSKNKNSGNWQMLKSAAINGVVYHHINIPDLQNPALLTDYGAFNVLEEATSFLDKAIQNGNVIVHCKEGQRRSPTMFLAWMITRGFDVDKGIKMIGKDYNDPNFDWKDKYVKTRASWIVELRKWERDWQLKQNKWKENEGKAMVEEWDRLFLGEASIATRVVKRKRILEEDEDTTHTVDSRRIFHKRRKEDSPLPAASCSARNRLNEMVRRFEEIEEHKNSQKQAEKRLRTIIANEAAKVEAATDGLVMASQAARRRAFEEKRMNGGFPLNDLAEGDGGENDPNDDSGDETKDRREAVEEEDEDQASEAGASNSLDSSDDDEAEAAEEDSLHDFIAFEAEEEEEEEEEEELTVTGSSKKCEDKENIKVRSNTQVEQKEETGKVNHAATTPKPIISGNTLLNYFTKK